MPTIPLGRTANKGKPSAWFSSQILCLFPIFLSEPNKCLHKILRRTALFHQSWGKTTRKHPKFVPETPKTRLKSGFLDKMAEKEGFEPSNRFWRLHDFQSCALVQLGDFSVYQILTFDLQFRADCGRGVSALACNMPAWWIIHETGQYFKQFLKIALPAPVQGSMIVYPFRIKKEVSAFFPCQGRRSRSSWPLTTAQMI